MSDDKLKNGWAHSTQAPGCNQEAVSKAFRVGEAVAHGTFQKMPVIARVRPPLRRPVQGLLGWHRHHGTAIAVPKHGRYVELVLHSRFRIQQGLIVFTQAFAPHADQISSGFATIVNLEIPNPEGLPCGVFELPLKACRPSWPQHSHDVLEMVSQLRVVAPEPSPAWLSEAFQRLLQTQSATATALEAGLSREHFHRSFMAAYSMSPGQALREHKVSKALNALSQPGPLAEIALECGFADQSHMARLLKAATGITAGQYRAFRHITPVQE
jgi:AraC family transcriptional regulator